MIFLRFCSCLDLNQMKYNTKMHKRSMWYFCEIYVKIWASAFSVEHVRRTPYQRNKMSFRTFSSLWREFKADSGVGATDYSTTDNEWSGMDVLLRSLTVFDEWVLNCQVSRVGCEFQVENVCSSWLFRWDSIRFGFVSRNVSRWATASPQRVLVLTNYLDPLVSPGMFGKLFFQESAHIL